MNEKESKDNPTSFDQPTPKELRVVKYNCGCIGFAPDERGRAVLLQSCDGDGGCLPGRFMGACRMLNAEEAAYWQQRIYDAMVKAQGFDNIKQALAPLLKEV